jgi:chromosome segregation ATPase
MKGENMAQSKIYNSNAERQRAYRERLKTKNKEVKRQATPRKQTRPQRLKRTIQELTHLTQEYENWLYALPENLSESGLAGQLEETTEQLQEAIELLEAVDVPRGFGR